MKALVFRAAVKESDLACVEEIVRSTGFFSEEEIGIACELVQETLEGAEASSYEFVFAEDSGVVVGYTAYGRIPGTESSYDLYWIAVHESQRGRGLGRILIEETERRITESGGKRVYAETSSRAQYQPTHAFYEACGYVRAAFLEDFYAEGDGRITYAKALLRK